MIKKSKTKSKKQESLNLDQTEVVKNPDLIMADSSPSDRSDDGGKFSPSLSTQIMTGKSKRKKPIQHKSIEDYIAYTSSTIIEKYEVDLYHICETYYEIAQEKLRIRDLIKSYPLFNSTSPAAQTCASLELGDFPNALEKDALLPIRHKLIANLCDLISALFIKWGLFNKQKYDFRYNIRCESVRVFDMNKIRFRCFNVETLWFCVAVKEGLIPEITTIELSQYSQILEIQTTRVFKLLLKKQCACIPSIEDAVGIRSKSYRTRYMDREPVGFLGENDYVSLDKPNFIKSKIYKEYYKEICELVESVKDLEEIYRRFERELVGRFLLLLL